MPTLTPWAHAHVIVDPFAHSCALNGQNTWDEHAYETNDLFGVFSFQSSWIMRGDRIV